MQIIIRIFLQNILPVFLLISLGFFLGRKFTIDINSLSKINFYLLIPSFMFTNLYMTEIGIEAIKALIVTLLILATNFLMGFLIAKFRKYDPGMGNAFQNSLMFYNSGNIGIPLITLVYSTGTFLINGETPYLTIALTTQIMVLLVQNVSINTFGFFNASRSNRPWKRALIQIFKMPAIYAVALAFLLKNIPFDFTLTPFWPALSYLKNALVPIALISLGVQLTKSKLKFNDGSVWLAVIVRLVIGPMIAYLYIRLLGVDGIVAQALLISSAVPTAVNTALIAVECKNHPDYATHIVVLSTLFASITLIAVIFLSTLWFPM